ncbi:hypothetical protein CCACVL1_05891 [Corchorus capsularis]|uniref:Uncharacterized protein n=1 Tax=Corchorus capsularis TaxID=210143 RepID=A0A1R3JIG8_COCAP|nr:hypothetical protein CCACVL1_05891 [Corchorus capsularis]
MVSWPVTRAQTCNVLSSSQPSRFFEPPYQKPPSMLLVFTATGSKPLN